MKIAIAAFLFAKGDVDVDQFFLMINCSLLNLAKNQ